MGHKPLSNSLYSNRNIIIYVVCYVPVLMNKEQMQNMDCILCAKQKLIIYNK